MQHKIRRHIVKRVVEKKTRQFHNGAGVSYLCGAASHEWRLRREDFKGSGWRRPAKTWNAGESGKQNSSSLPRKGFADDTVSISQKYNFLLLSPNC